MTRRKQNPPETLPRDHPLAALDGVKPLGGAKRVPAATGSGRHAPVRVSSVEPPRFVVERHDEHVRAYREELGPGALRAVSGTTFAVEHSVDLHGRRAADVRNELARIVRESARRGVRRLLVIHGKGLHSEGGAGVLAALVIEALTDGPASRWVRALSTAPRRLGGSGATIVALGD